MKLTAVLWEIHRTEAGVYEDFSGRREYKGGPVKEPYTADPYTQRLFDAAYGDKFDPNGRKPALSSVITIEKCRSIVPPAMLKSSMIEVMRKFNEVSTKHLHNEYEEYKRERGEDPGKGNDFLKGVADWYEKKTIQHNLPRIKKPDPTDIRGLLTTWVTVANVFDMGVRARTEEDKVLFVDTTVSLQHNKGSIFEHFPDKSWGALT